MENWLKLRIKLLKRISKLDKELEFIGFRGEMYLDESQLQELIKRLEEEIKKKV